MTNNKFLFLLVFISLICLISILYSLNNIEQLNKYKNETLLLKYSIEEKKEQDDFFSQINDTIYFSELFYSNHRVIDQFFYWGKDHTNNIKLSLFLKNGKVLFFNYPNNACYSCVQSLIEMLNDSFHDYINANNIVFLSQDIEARFKDNLHGKVVMTTSAPIIPFKEFFLAEAPCFFIVDETMQIKYIHFYNKSDDNRTRIYLKFISSYLKS